MFDDIMKKKIIIYVQMLQILFVSTLNRKFAKI
jgi:hypothetical protein